MGDFILTIAEEFKSQLKELAGQARPEPTGVVTIAGLTFRARRVPLSQWILSGRVPQSLAMAYESGEEPPGPPAVEDTPIPDPAETLSIFRFREELISAVMVEPKVVWERRTLADDEVWSGHLPEEFILGVIRWAFLGCPGIPVAMEDGGDVPLEAVQTFRENPMGKKESVGGGLRGEDVWPTAKPVNGNH